MIDKIIERLEKKIKKCGKNCVSYGIPRISAYEKAICIVKQVAAEQNTQKYIIDELTRKSLVDRFANITSDYEERELSETDVEGLNYEDLNCIMECLQFGQLNSKKQIAEENTGCEYCNNEDLNDTVCYLPTEYGNGIDLDFNYCPMCGRKLSKEAD